MGSALTSKDSWGLELMKTAKSLRSYTLCYPTEAKIPNRTFLYKHLNTRKNLKKLKRKAANCQTFPTSWPKCQRVPATPTNQRCFCSPQTKSSRILLVAHSTVQSYPTKTEFLPVDMDKSMPSESEKLNPLISLLKSKSKALLPKLIKSSVESQSVGSLLTEKSILQAHWTTKSFSTLHRFVSMIKLLISSLLLSA